MIVKISRPWGSVIIRNVTALRFRPNYLAIHAPVNGGTYYTRGAYVFISEITRKEQTCA